MAADAVADAGGGAGAGTDGDPPALALGRVHEGCGPARRTLAILLAAAARGPVLWIAPAHAAERLHAAGVAAAGLDPARLTLVDAPRPDDILWSTETALRHLAATGAGGMVVADLAGPPGLVAVRRLHLAAGGADGGGSTLPLGLLLTPEDGGAQGIESRWHFAPEPSPEPSLDASPDHSPAHTAWRLERRRARGAAPAAWRLEAPATGPLRRHRLASPDPA
ncbi:hypothetical protein CCR87_09435 [Rhodobaculum claviforme]|uniref:Protein ImuA n=1 Tax=Rhodobaculum claviforme TaxID=1549854 RepID=A0A934TK16_9RHOB|nr:hypothetical protein [Rhodobaculum claviforme]